MTQVKEFTITYTIRDLSDGKVEVMRVESRPTNGQERTSCTFSEVRCLMASAIEQLVDEGNSPFEALAVAVGLVASIVSHAAESLEAGLKSGEDPHETLTDWVM